MNDLDLDHLRQWIGRTEHRTDTAPLVRTAGLNALLDRDRVPGHGDPLPPGGHWLCFLDAVRQSALGSDGHAERGGFLPPVPLPRRMWAGGRLRFLAPIRIGRAIRRLSTIDDVYRRDGRGGAMIFVIVRHEIGDDDGTPLLTEEHDIVYREAAATGTGEAPGKTAPRGAPWHRVVVPDPVMLFRYSAVTFNGHRIHYDHPYATGSEGYPGLVVHGPLTATLLMDLCAREAPGMRLTAFDFRAVRPLFDTAPFTLNGRPAVDGRSAELWAADADGFVAMQAEARFAG